MSQKSKNQIPSSDYYYHGKITNQKRELKKIVTAPEYRLLEKYETVMINESLADATKCKHFETILSLTRILSKKSWLTLTQDDIDGLISNVMQTFHISLSKNLKLFFGNAKV